MRLDSSPLMPASAGGLLGQRSMTTGSAVMTYNILLGERRRVGALLIAVD